MRIKVTEKEATYAFNMLRMHNSVIARAAEACQAVGVPNVVSPDGQIVGSWSINLEAATGDWYLNVPGIKPTDLAIIRELK